MLRKHKKEAISFSDKIAELLLRPGSDERNEESDSETTPRVENEFNEYDNLEDARSTEIRKKNVKLLSDQSARYKGKVVSRNYLEEEDNSLEAEKNYACKLSSSDELVQENSSNHPDEEGSIVTDDDSSSYEDGSDDGSETEKVKVITETNHRAEIQKGTCVQNQLRIWEKLLELRIHSQKVLNKANRLPTQSPLNSLRNENPELQHVSQECAKNTSTLLKSLLELQNTLSNQFSEIRNSLKNTLKRPLSSATSEDLIPVKRFANHLGSHFTEMRTYRNAVLLKWDDRTKLLVPGAGAKRKSLNEEFDIVRKIESALMNHSVLITKSQFLKSGNDTETEQTSEAISPKVSQSNADIYDDSEFYHQQLRELIEYKANTTSNMSEVTKQYVELQKLRQKMKKKVDMRASKGRKLRYVVHNKLINFMAPQDSSNWTEGSKNELCKSLFAS